MAPVMYENHQGSALVQCINLLDIADLAYDFLDDILYLPNIPSIAVPVLHLVPRTTWTIVEGIVGVDQEFHIDLARMPMMARNDVGGTSTKNLLHWIQWIREGKFQQYDYGKDGNEAQYGSKSPPEYAVDDFPTQLAGVPMMFFAGYNDYFAQDDDFNKVLSHMPSSTQVVRVEDYNHLDYMWAADANGYVNSLAVQFILGLEETKKPLFAQ